MKTVIVDTNIVLRYFLRDEPKLYEEALGIFRAAEAGEYTIYFDELVVAEVVWVMTSYYKRDKYKVTDALIELVSQEFVENVRKSAVLRALQAYQEYSLSYIDCWLLIVAEEGGFSLETQDKKLLRVFRKGC